MKEMFKKLCEGAIKNNNFCGLGDSVEVMEITTTKKKTIYKFDYDTHFIVRANVDGHNFVYDIGIIGNKLHAYIMF